MPLIENIPLPGTPQDAFMKGGNFMQNIINSKNENQLNQAKLQQQQQKMPLEMDLLRAKILEAQANAKRAEKGTPQDIKNQLDVQNHVTNIQQLKRTAENLKRMLTEDPNLTGLEQGTKYRFNLPTRKGLGEFVNQSQELQQGLARLALSSGRLGIGAINWAGYGKTGEFKPVNTNLDILNGIIKGADSDIDLLNKNYKSQYGDEIPSIKNQVNKTEFNLPSFSNKEEFQQWYNQQSDETKNKVRDYLKGNK